MELKSKEITNARDVKGHGARFCFLLTVKRLCSQLMTEHRDQNFSGVLLR